MDFDDLAVDPWAAAFTQLAKIAAADVTPPTSWPDREARMRHVCRLLAAKLDALAPGTPRRREVARTYARAFSLLVVARQRAADDHADRETERPGPG